MEAAMLSQDIFSLRRYLESKLNTYSKIDLGTADSIAIIQQLEIFEERIVAMENAVIKSEVKNIPPRDTGNVILFNSSKTKRG
ncbi:MAG: hypothetical protein DI551_05280 [Micavibrio aeruginosavorus]|uniref:Uncharacterized protein n=1 Tax=Micavibrio aeruginosavorus TaxID=349221 RepID=A0A2W5N109_9BACT|nr:MAG: hypothetical protein DI551_05280 [Micavibrio aeruginosavorus]